MNIHEYQAKDLFRLYGIPVSAGRMAQSAEEAVEIAKELNSPYILKAQIHSGGRGKAALNRAAGRRDVRVFRAQEFEIHKSSSLSSPRWGFACGNSTDIVTTL